MLLLLQRPTPDSEMRKPSQNGSLPDLGHSTGMEDTFSSTVHSPVPSIDPWAEISDSHDSRVQAHRYCITCTLLSAWGGEEEESSQQRLLENTFPKMMFSRAENSGTNDYQTVRQEVEFGVGEEAADERKGKYTTLQTELCDIQEGDKGNDPKFIWGQVHLWLSESF
ncbi:hypothetical protein llap_12677 [Limosa lapponica baueri]|uniref:Uncharacterized protein n=1 Tax=Limosa lapponica baueri TaxID=1758121 RepID=A0A2I0TT96_LIMLA|nr:hypothetical protein llap_12677 [Limosa lapponica baueri]